MTHKKSTQNIKLKKRINLISQTEKNLNKKIIQIKNLIFWYQQSSQPSINKLSIDIYQNEFIVVLGHNGSGKSTFSKLIGGILKQQFGEIFIDGVLICKKNLAKIHKKIGIIFQNPENQFIGTTVYDDIMFGLQNYNVPTDELNDRINEVAEIIGIKNLLNKEAADLSGGEKQKVAIASILALKPDIIVFDESTSMVDGYYKKQILEIMKDLQKNHDKTIISITHDMDETLLADRVLVLNHGKLEFFCTPEKLFSNYKDHLLDIKLSLPFALAISSQIPRLKNTLHSNILFNDLKKFLNKNNNQLNLNKKIIEELNNKNLSSKKNNLLIKKATSKIISINNFWFSYDYKLFNKNYLFKNYTGQFLKNKINIIVGGTGSGKSTLIQVIAALLPINDGSINIKINKNDVFLIKNNQKIYLNDKKTRVINFNKQIGVIFQICEYQLFNLTVAKEVAFAYVKFNNIKHNKYKNKTKLQKLFQYFSIPYWLNNYQNKISQPKVNKLIKDTLKLVDLDFKYLNTSPFDLSGGEKRRVAIASVLIYNPNIIIFDEPTAGLDPKGTEIILNLIKKLKEKYKKTILMITHDTDQALQLGDTLTLIEQGKLIKFGTPYNVLSNQKLIDRNFLITPKLITLFRKLKIENFLVKNEIRTIQNAINWFNTKIIK